MDVGKIAQQQIFDQAQANTMQTYLGQRLFTQLHTSATTPPVLAANIKDTLKKAMNCLQTHAQLQVLLGPVSINHLPVVSLEQQLQTLYAGTLLTTLNAAPQVRLHGDLFLENMLLPARDPGQNWPQHLILIDPISVAGIGAGHPLFDLGKYESYANGELPAMRQERLLISGFEVASKTPTSQPYYWAVDWQDPAMAGFKNIDWHGQIRSLYVQHYGPVQTALYELLQAYFAAAMVVCTQGREQQARALKMRASLQLALTPVR